MIEMLFLGLWYIHVENGVTNATPSLADVQGRTYTVSETKPPNQRGVARAAMEEVRESRTEWRAAEREWRQVRRDTALALGLPATNGLAWSPAEAYAAVATVTNANSRRDLHLRAVQSDLTQTRQQLEQQFPAVAWWWVDEKEDDQ